MAQVIVVGGGMAGCGAALAAAKAGAEVTLLERTDMLLGVAVRSGVTGGNGTFVAQHELRFLGGGELFDALESIKLHADVQFADMDKHTYIFNTGLAEPLIKRIVNEAGVKTRLESRVVDVEKAGGRILAVRSEDGSLVEGDAFVDCTGTRGGISACTKYGQGCVMCLVRCFAFGNRVGIVEKAGGKELHRRRPDGTPGVLIGSINVYKDTLSPWLKTRIEEEGVVRVPLPSEIVDYFKAENLTLTDIGPVARCFRIRYMALDQLRKAPGLESVQVEEPRSSKYNHIAGVSMAERDNSMKVEGFENLFCAGEKSGPPGVNAAIVTGYIAGHNAARTAFEQEPLVLPTSLAIGDWITYFTERYKTEEGLKNSYFMAWGEYWGRMQNLGLFTDDVSQIRSRVEEVSMLGVLSRKLT